MVLVEEALQWPAAPPAARASGRTGRPTGRSTSHRWAPMPLAEDGLVDKVQLPRKAVGRVWAEAVLGGGRLDEAQDLAEAVRRGRQSGPVSPQVHLDALHDVGPLRSLRFGLLSPEAHEQEEVGEAVEGGVCEVQGVHAIEVVDIVAAHEEEQGAGEELDVARPVKVPHRGRRPEAVCRMVPLCEGTFTR